MHSLYIILCIISESDDDIVNLVLKIYYASLINYIQVYKI